MRVAGVLLFMIVIVWIVIASWIVAWSLERIHECAWYDIRCVVDFAFLMIASIVACLTLMAVVVCALSLKHVDVYDP